MEPLKRKPFESEDASATKRTKSDRPPVPLPPEMWALIFRHLNAHWLKSARQTCSSWNQIIRGSSRLMEKLVLTLNKENFAGDRKHVRELLAAGGGYTRAKFSIVRIGQFKPGVNWLKPLGETLRSLNLEVKCTHAFLTRMLREIPNLTQLSVIIHANGRFQSIVPNFRLEKLRELSIIYDPTPNVVRFFAQICPRLKVLKFGDGYGWDYEQEAVAFVKAVSATLDELELDVSKKIVDGLMILEDLRLKRLSVRGTDDDVLRLISYQPNLEVLNFTSHCQVSTFGRIIPALTKLKTIQVWIDYQNGPTSLSLLNLRHIETLFIGYDKYEFRDSQLELQDCSFQNLRHLSLCRCKVPIHVLECLRSTKLSTLTLKNCHVERLSDLLRVESLIHVEFIGSNTTAELVKPDPANNCSRVRSLKLTQVGRNRQQAMIKLFRNLERLDLSNCAEVDAEMLQEISRFSPKLKELGMFVYSISLPGIRKAVNRFVALQTLTVHTMVRNTSADRRGIRSGIAVELHVK